MIASSAAICACGDALEPVVDLVLEEIARLLQQVDVDQPPREVADHLVAARAGRRQLAEIVEQRQRLDRVDLRRPRR